MGTFLGHAAPGTFFLLFAIHWTYRITRRLITCSDNAVPYYNSLTFPCLCGRASKWPLEGLMKIVAGVTGIIAETITSFEHSNDGQVSFFYGNFEHMTMYGFFMLSGIIDILQTRLSSVPKGMDYAALALGFAGEFVLFKYHLHGRSEFDVLVHTLLLYAIGACVISTLIELKFPANPLAGYVRAYTVFVQATWLIQVGFILYNPIPGSQPWDEKNMENLMVVTMMFCWHLVGVVLCMMVIVFAVRMFCRHNTCSPLQGKIEYKLFGDKDIPLRGYSRVVSNNENSHVIRIKNNEEEVEEDLSEAESPLLSEN